MNELVRVERGFVELLYSPLRVFSSRILLLCGGEISTPLENLEKPSLSTTNISSLEQEKIKCLPKRGKYLHASYEPQAGSNNN